MPNSGVINMPTEALELKSIPVIDSWDCSKCEGCISLCPSVFRVNELSGDIEVVELDFYPEEEIMEAIRDCPKDCISWED